jgi:hypothetical protein
MCSQGPAVDPYTEQFEFSPLHPTLSLIFIFILPSHLCPVFHVFFSCFQSKMGYALFITSVRPTYPPPPNSFFLILQLLIFDKGYKSRSCSVCISLNLSFTSTLVEIFSNTLFQRQKRSFTPVQNNRQNYSLYILIREPDCSIGITPGYELDDRGSIPGRGKRFIVTPPLPDRPVQWVLGDLSPGVKRMGYEADHLPLT